MSALVLFKLRESARTTTKSSPVYPSSSLSSVAATSLLSLLLCCCCCAAASAVPRSAMHREGRSAMLIRNAYSCQKVSLRCSIFFIWRSGLSRGAGTKNSNSTSPPPLLLYCCCCAAAAVLLKTIALPHQAFQHETCKISQGDAELKGFVKCCWCCGAPSAAPRSAILPIKMFRFGVPFPSLAFWFAPGCCDRKQQLHGAAARRGALTSNLAWV